MSSLHIDELYGNSNQQIAIPNGFEVTNPSLRRSYSTRIRGGNGNGSGVRSYATVTQALNDAYRNFRAGGGSSCGSCSNCGTVCRSHGGSGSTGCTGGGCTCHCSGGNCQDRCRSKGYTYVRTAGSNCICDTGGAAQKCNLTAAMCKANNPRASSCSVRTYTNGSCVCDCKTGTGQNLTPAAAPGTVRSVSKPVTRTNLKPGVVPGSSTPIQTQTTGKFGSYDIATLRAQPAGTYAKSVADAAVARQYGNLRLLQTTEGQSLHAQLNSVNAKAKKIQQLMRDSKGAVSKEAQVLYNELKEDAKKTLELHRKWKASFNGAAYAKSPDGFKMNPVKNKEAKEIEEAIEKGAGTAYGLSSIASKSPLGPLAGPIVDTIGDIATGAVTGNPPDPAGLAGNFTESLKTAVTNPPVPPTMEIITNMINDSGVQQMLLGRTFQGTIPA